MSTTTFVEVQHAAAMALCAAGLRHLYAATVSAEPEVVSLALRVTADAIPGLTVIEVEALDRSGMAVGGWSL